jgi:hypothetical protein
MMRHVELNHYWMYEYKEADGSRFVIPFELTEEELRLAGFTFEKKIQMHYTVGVAND